MLDPNVSLDMCEIQAYECIEWNHSESHQSESRTRYLSRDIGAVAGGIIHRRHGTELMFNRKSD